MKRYIILIMCALPLMCCAQDYGKMSRYVRELCRDNTLSNKAKGVTAGWDSPTLSPERETMNHADFTFVLVKGEEDAVADYCLRHQGDIHICQVPVERLAELSEDCRVVRIEAKASDERAMLERTAEKVGATQVWQGASLPKAFTGKGSLVGVIDGCIDYTHPTFRSAEDGRLRIVRVWDMVDLTAESSYNWGSNVPLGAFLTTAEGILSKGGSKDCALEFHGTHTTSTAAGSGLGTPYSGLAPEADIYSVCKYLNINSDLVDKKFRDYYTTAFEMLAFQNIFDYADSIGKPCVINCSYGGSQDMTDEDVLMNEYFEKMTGPGHIIVASIGNEGSRACHLPKSATTPSVGGRVSCSSSSFTINVSTRQKLKMHVTYHAAGGDVRRTYDLDFLPGNTAEKSPAGLNWYNHCEFDTGDIFNGLFIDIYSADNGFDKSYVGYDIFLAREDKDFTNNIYTIEFEGEGVEADIFAQGGSLLPATNYSPTLTGALPNSGNCGSPAALPSVIGVGSVTHAITWKTAEGVTHNMGTDTTGKVSTFSSRGPSLHGFTKPDVVAPGNVIAAAISSQYAEAKAKDAAYHITQFTEDSNGKKYPWGICSGTSMSAPVVSGIVALWLEADPTLTKEKIMDVIAATSRQPDSSMSYPNNTYGYGEIDAYKGLLYILNMTGVRGLSAEHLREATVRPAAGGITVTLPEAAASTLPVRVYGMGGALLQTAAIAAGEVEVTLAVPAKGIVAVQVGALGSTLVKL